MATYFVKPSRGRSSRMYNCYLADQKSGWFGFKKRVRKRMGSQGEGDNGLRNSEWSPSHACTRWDSEKTEIRSRSFGKPTPPPWSVYKLDLKPKLRTAILRTRRVQQTKIYIKNIKDFDLAAPPHIKKAALRLLLSFT